MKFRNIATVALALLVLTGTVILAEEVNSSEESNWAVDFSGLAMFRFVGVDKDVSPFNRYTTVAGKDNEVFFEIPQIGFGLGATWKDKVTFYTHLNYNPELNGKYINDHYDGSDNKVALIEASVAIKDIFGPVDTKIGRFGLPFSTENIGPLRTSEYTIFPSAGSAILNNIIVTGITASYGMEEDSENIFAWSVGLNSGMKKFNLPFYGPALKQYMPHTDIMTDPSKDSATVDSRIGSHFFAEMRDASKHFRLAGYYYTNGVNGSRNEDQGVRLTGGYFSGDWNKVTLVVQLVNGNILYYEPVTFDGIYIQDMPEYKFQSVFFLTRVELAKNHFMSARYEIVELSYDPGFYVLPNGINQNIPRGRNQLKAYTLCYSWKISDHLKFAVEYLRLDNEDWWKEFMPVKNLDIEDDIMQMNLTVSF